MFILQTQLQLDESIKISSNWPIFSSPAKLSLFCFTPLESECREDTNDVGWANFSAFDQNIQPAANPLLVSSSTPSNIVADSCSDAFATNTNSIEVDVINDKTSHKIKAAESSDTEAPNLAISDTTKKPLPTLVNQPDGETTQVAMLAQVIVVKYCDKCNLKSCSIPQPQRHLLVTTIKDISIHLLSMCACHCRSPLWFFPTSKQKCIGHFYGYGNCLSCNRDLST